MVSIEKAVGRSANSTLVAAQVALKRSERRYCSNASGDSQWL